ncbi:MAG: FAD-binding oxidoreductase, partial [Myxococcales bacterium]|nr:FAD-binding oxidoreductase [Myxococcales bacterium]
MEQARKPEPVAESVRSAARKIVGDQWFLDSTADKLAYGRDCWPLTTLWTRGGKVFQYTPDFVAVPANTSQIVELVQLAKESGTPLIPYGAGSGVCGGVLPLQGGFTVDVKRLDRMLELDQDALTVRAQAGAIGMHLEAA